MKNRISTERVQGEFRSLLDDKSNKRIVLSGIYGIGKTTFIREFFENRKEYVCLKLFPVNYSVASNEDIFELIKYDLFYELLSRDDLKISKLNVNWFQALNFITYEDLKEVMGDFVSIIPRIGKQIKPITEPILEALRVFSKVPKIISDKKKKLEHNELDDILEYAKLFETNVGGIYENDFYTQLIESIIASLKEGDDVPHREVILVIDDLDRIDPEHVFRILNVFAAHFDRYSVTDNKFGIDKIIISCDIDNIRRIYINKYGPGVDFSGYIDKFFSKGVFNFRNYAQIIEKVPSILSTIKSAHSNYLFYENTRNYCGIFLRALLQNAITRNDVNLRMLYKYHSREYQPQERRIHGLEHQGITIRNFAMMMLFEFLIDLTGDENTVTRIFSRDESSFESNKFPGHLIFGDLCYLTNLDRILGREEIAKTRYNEIQVTITGGVDFLEDGKNTRLFYATLTEPKDIYQTHPKFYNEMLVRAFENYRLLRK